VGKIAMTLKENGVTWLRRTVLQTGSQGPDGPCPPDPPHRPELLAGFCCGGSSAYSDAIERRG